MKGAAGRKGCFSSRVWRGTKGLEAVAPLSEWKAVAAKYFDSCLLECGCVGGFTFGCICRQREERDEKGEMGLDEILEGRGCKKVVKFLSGVSSGLRKKEKFLYREIVWSGELF